MRQARATTRSPPSPRRTRAWSWSQLIGDSPIGYERLTLKWWGRYGCWTSSWTEPASQRRNAVGHAHIRPGGLSSAALLSSAPATGSCARLVLLPPHIEVDAVDADVSAELHAAIVSPDGTPSRRSGTRGVLGET